MRFVGRAGLFPALTLVPFLIALVACGKGPVQIPDLKPPERFDAMDGVVQEQYSELKAALDGALAESEPPPVIAERLAKLGMWYQIYGFHDSASMAYESAVGLHPESPKWIFLNGISMSAMGRLEAAEDAFRKTLELDPDYLAAEVRLAETLVSQGKGDEEIVEHLESALRAEPGTVRAMVLLADRWRRAGRAEEAVKLLDQALQLQDSPQIHFHLGMAFRDAGSLDLANAHLAKSDPEMNPEGLFMKDPYFAEVARMDIGYSTAMKRARRAMTQRNYILALSQFRRAGDLRTASLEPRLGAVRAMLGLDRLMEAKTEADRLVESYPDRPKVHFVAGRVHEALEPGSGEPFFLKALELDGDLFQAMLILASIYEDRGRLSEALDLLSRARGIRPGHVDASPRYARMLIQLGRIDEAKRVLNEDIAVTESPGPLVVLMDELGMEIQ